MSETACTLQRRDELLVAYLYDDLGPDERQTFTAHLVRCATCRSELDELRGVRIDLAQWTPPAPARVLTFQPMPARGRLWSALGGIPAWTQVAAALLVLGVAAAIANFEVRVDDSGFTVRTGWAATSGPGPEADLSGAAPAAASAAAGNEAPWRADLAALETALRADLQRAAPVVPRAASDGDDAALLRQVRTLIAASESSQRRELALRVAEVARDFQVQRNADLQRIQRNLTVLESTTTGEIVKQRTVLNNLATWASQRQ